MTSITPAIADTTAPVEKVPTREFTLSIAAIEQLAKKVDLKNPRHYVHGITIGQELIDGKVTSCAFHTDTHMLQVFTGFHCEGDWPTTLIVVCDHKLMLPIKTVKAQAKAELKRLWHRDDISLSQCKIYAHFRSYNEKIHDDNLSFTVDFYYKNGDEHIPIDVGRVEVSVYNTPSPVLIEYLLYGYTLATDADITKLPAFPSQYLSIFPADCIGTFVHVVGYGRQGYYFFAQDIPLIMIFAAWVTDGKPSQPMAEKIVGLLKQRTEAAQQTTQTTEDTACDNMSNKGE